MRRLVGCAVLLLAVVVLSRVNVSAADMLSGTWKLNVAKSKYSPGPPPKGPNTQKIEATDNGYKVTADGVNAQGQKTHNEYSVKFDGMDYPFKPTVDGKPDPNAPDMVSAKKIDDYTFEQTTKRKGSVLGTVRYVISKDGKTRTGTQTGTNAQGQTINNTLVYEKQ